MAGDRTGHQAAPRFPRWNLHADPERAAGVAETATACLAHALACPAPERLALLCDTRAMHRRIFAAVAPPDLPEAAGTYRGTPGSRLELARRAVFTTRRLPGLRSRDLCAPPDTVPLRMTALATALSALWQDPPQDEDRALAALARFTHDFLQIHPYLDGNGHIYRIMAVLLGRHLGLRDTSGWNIARRPYDHHMSLCLQWYPHHPDLLAAYLRKWFR